MNLNQHIIDKNVWNFLANSEKSEEARCIACLTCSKSEEARASVPQWLHRLCV